MDIKHTVVYPELFVDFVSHIKFTPHQHIHAEKRSEGMLCTGGQIILLYFIVEVV